MRVDTVLTDEELAGRATQLATVCEDIAGVKLEQKEVNAEFKERIDLLEKDRMRLARTVRTHMETRDVDPPLLKLEREASA